ncbi:pilus assembly protein TadG-related protein [Devosia sediminis]|uniref:Pilus assembly protein n=1 Tax=Devosia sediminis TaxID=2798801 RepID=A0A934J2Z8_9HYPH|nr:TadE/TadG family type IV pilus assembly protein [Devosia sediminis]MBJ3786734.1 pilus assembly protein [Devosia sediminis]
MRIVGRFLRNRDGNVAVIVAFLILPMLVLAGGATDIARFEAHRAQLQDGVDRAVLAAASLQQTVPVETTVADYLKTLSFVDDVDLDYDYTTGLNARTIKVTASYVMPTGFLPLIGINELNVVVAATAQEKRSNIEMSLMLDFSGSMAGSKYTSLKSAATQFVNTMITPQTSSFTSLNIVPYAGQVSVGQTIFDAMHGARSHYNSSCFLLSRPDYGAGLINLAGRAQVPHFTRWNGSDEKPTLPANMNPGWCPSDNTAITFMSNNRTDLVNKIAGYQMYDGTGTAIAMNWGLMLLDPALRPLIMQAVAHGMVPAAFAGRPADFHSANTLKVLILMTDGAITEQFTAKDPSKDVRTGANWKLLRDTTYNTDQTTTETKKHFNTVCAAAKTHGVMVFTIGFQLSDSDANQLAMKNELRNCASSASHYYDVQGLNIAAAFSAIATTIQKVKLTQ